MEYTAPRVVDLLASIPWQPNSVLRIFWVRYSEGSRAAFAKELSRVVGSESIVALTVRDDGFKNANAILSDIQRLFTANQAVFEDCQPQSIQRISVILLGKDDFKLPQGASPITLPHWFPVSPGRETFFEIADLAMNAEAALLDCPEARIEQIAEFTYRLETALVERLAVLQQSDPGRLHQFVRAAHGGGAINDCVACLIDYQRELALTQDPRAYRPNAAKDAKSLISRLLKLVLNSSPKQISSLAQGLADCFKGSDHIRLKPTLFAIMSRPASKMSVQATNWHAIMLAFYQGYQLMNGAAHAGEYPNYSISLQFVSSVDLRHFLMAARSYVDALN
ncbi:hypothetical protein [Alcaligenes faecalis]|uniref:hypothetical protein n=1 Tax=Alcaligenes faecalis TaxID=511 RepID=UPI001C83B2C5|nr:hypothetical protein [Alcaligenes faecalis]MBX6965809.1 hypothetical protein [Providencia rettgeri]MBX7031387.1 hypothetical protein [Alcaligenes faecalis]